MSEEVVHTRFEDSDLRSYQQTHQWQESQGSPIALRNPRTRVCPKVATTTSRDAVCVAQLYAVW